MIELSTKADVGRESLCERKERKKKKEEKEGGCANLFVSSVSASFLASD